MTDLFTDFLRSPNGKSFANLRKAIIDMPEYDMYCKGLRHIEGLYDKGSYEQIKEYTPNLMPNWLLSAPVHLLLSRAADARGDSEAAAHEKLMAQACLFGLQDTGDGSLEQPFLPLHIADEYLLLGIEGKSSKLQKRVDKDGRAFDLLVCEDDSEIYFDITDCLAAMSKKLNL